MRFYRSVQVAVLVAAALFVVGGAAPALAAVVPPAQRALELPAGVTSLPATDPLVAAILNAGTSTTGGTVTCTAPATFNVGTTLVTWRDLSDNSTVGRYVFAYPYGYQVLGQANNLRIFEHNGGRHILYDRDKRVHTIYTDGTKVWYRLGVRSGSRLYWRDAVQVNSSTTPIAWSTLGTRGETFAMTYDASNNVIVQCTWSSVWPVNRAILTRRLTVDAAGNISTGAITNTGLTGSFQSIAADSTGRMHLAVELYSAILYSWSDNGVTWNNTKNWSATDTQCSAYRFPNIVIDSHDRLHVLWQAEGYLNYQGSSGRGLWWTGLYAMYQPSTGIWSTPANVLSGISGWGAPTSSQQTLFAYPNLLVDDQNNLHLAWHGTAYSHVYAMDDTFYLEKVYNAGSGTWGAWTNYATLHKRYDAGSGGGEDPNFTWVPSLAYRAGSSDLYAVIMYGTADDEVTDPSVNITDSLLKTRIGMTWQAGFQNVTQTADLRSWYGNVPPQALVDPNGHVWLDTIWVDGTLDPDGTADYNVLFRRLDLGGGLAGDSNGDGHVDILDLLAFSGSWGRKAADTGYNYACDFNCDDVVDILDLLLLAGNWGT